MTGPVILTLTRDFAAPPYERQTRDGWTMILAGLATALENDNG